MGVVIIRQRASNSALNQHSAENLGGGWRQTDLSLVALSNAEIQQSELCGSRGIDTMTPPRIAAERHAHAFRVD